MQRGDCLVSADSDGSTLLPITCFMPGTLLLTDQGERPIEELRIGDRLISASGPKPVK